MVSSPPIFHLPFTICHLPALVVHNLCKAFRLQTRSSDKGAVNVCFRHQSSDVLRLYRATIKYSESLRHFLGVSFRENAPDKRVHFLRLLRRRRASCTNCPNRLVSNDDTVEV